MTDDQTATTGTQTGATAANPYDGLVTKSGKAVTDFAIPEKLLKGDPGLIDLIMRSEAMDDAERQYWFNLTDVMNSEQKEKLRGILTRERKKLAEIHAKYGKKPPVDPVKAAAEAKRKAAARQAQLEETRKKEAAAEAAEASEETLDDSAWA